MLLTLESGERPQTPEEAQALVDKGYLKCYNGKCDFHLSPESQQNVLNNGSGYYTCPRCKHSHDIMEDVPWHGASSDQAEYNQNKFEQERYEPDEDSWRKQQQQGGFVPGGTTRIGLNLEEQAQIGEDVVKGLGSLPGYGPIVWWHEGHAGSVSPLDGATKEWGIEVKTIGYDATHHRFIPGSTSEKEAKNMQTEEMGLKGVLGVLVLLNYRTSEADVYVKEMPITPWKNSQGKTFRGVTTFRSNTGQHLVERVKFNNPFMEPENGAPHVVQDDTPF